MLTLLNLLSAIALLVWGTHIVRTGVLRVYGSQLRQALARGIDNRFVAFLAGIGVTALVQSSNATALLATSFVSQGLMGLAPALAIMLGADVGTALMARVLTLDLAWLSPLLIFTGVLLFLSRKETRLGQVGRTLTGLGLILLALSLIVAAAQPITESQGVQVLFASLTGDLLLDALVGAVFAMLTYSSLAAVLLTATLAGAGMIGLPVAIGLVVGANIGSGLLAYLNSAAQSPAGRRVALGNLLYKLLGLLLVMPLLPPLENWMAGSGYGAATLVIGFHLAYNGLRCLLLLPTSRAMARLCLRLLPDRAEQDGVARPRHLDVSALESPALALPLAVRETLRMGDLVDAMLGDLLQVLRHGEREPGRRIHRRDDDVDALYGAVKLYLARIPREAMSDAENRRWASIVEMAVNLEHAGDIIEHMLDKLQHHKHSRRHQFSDSGLAELGELHAALSANLRLGLGVFMGEDAQGAERLLREKRKFRLQERRMAQAHVDRLGQRIPQSLETSSLHLELITDMKRLNSLFCSAAYPALEQSSELERRLSSDADDAARTPPGRTA